MSSLPNGLTFQVVLTPPSGGNVSALRKQIQSGLGNIQANVQLNNAATANKQINAISASTNKATKETKSFGDAIGLAGRNFAAYSSAVAIVGRLSIALSRATRDAIKFEREFVKLAQVFDTSVKNLKGLSNQISVLSQEYGLSANIIAKTSVVLAQSGLTARETERALNALAKTTLASTFQNIGLTAEGAIAIIAQFGEGVGALEAQLGAINAVSKKFAVESGDIIEAVRRGGGAFKAANGTFTEFISLFTAVRSTTRESAETISTGFRTIFARLQRPKVIDYFKELNIQLEDGQGNFVGAFEAVKRLSEGLDRAGIKAGQIKFAEVVEQLGGIRQVSRVIPLLGQFTKAEKARQVALAGGASLDADVAKAQETTAQAIERTRQNFAALIREISQTESFKQIVNLALKMSNAFLDIARTIKPLIPLIAILGSLKLGGILATATKTGFTAQGLGSKRPFAKGGPVLGFNRGGSVPGTGNGDTVPAMLEPGEFVIRKSAVQAFGVGGLADINKYANGGKAIAKIGSLGPLVKKDSKRVLDKKGRNTITASDSLEVAINDIAISAQRVQNLADKGNSDAKKLVTSQGKGAGVRRGPIWEKIAAKILRKKLPSGSLSRPLDSVNTDYKYKPKSQAINSIEIARKRIQDSFGINGGFRTDKSLLKSYTSRRGEKKVGKEVSIVRPDWNILDPSSFSRNLTTKGKTARKKRLLKKALGGSISGTDTVPALLTPGEFVINKKSAQAFGYGGLAKINKYATGGRVGVQKFADGGEVGGSGGFDFITSAAAEFGILLFSLNAIAKPLKQFQDGLKKGGNLVKDQIKFDKLLASTTKDLTDKLKTVKDKISQNSVDRQAAEEAVVDAKRPRSATGKPNDVNKYFSKLKPDGAGGFAPEKGRNLRKRDRALAGQSNDDLAKDSIKLREAIFKLTKSSEAADQAQTAYILDVAQAQKKYKELSKETENLKLAETQLAQGIKNVKAGKSVLDNTGIQEAAKGLKVKLEEAAKKIGQSVKSFPKNFSAGARGLKRKAGESIKRAGQAATNNPLAVVAGVAASLRTVIGGVSKTFRDVADQAIASGDAEEAASNAKLAAEYGAINDFTTASVGAGAAIGSAFGPVGTIIGSFAGALVGALSTFKPFQDAIDGVIQFLNWLPGVDIETFAGAIEKAEKAARDAANRNKLEKEIEAIGTKFRNLGRDIDPQKNLSGFVSAADELAKVTNEQALSIKQNPIFKEDGKTIDKDEQARRLSENSKAAADAFAAASEAANAQGVSLQKLAQDSPELAKAFKESLPPGEAQAIWNQMIQVNQAAVAAIAAENAAKQRGIAIFLAQLSIQVRLNASLEAFDAALSRQKDSLANLDFAISGSVGKKEIGSNLTDFDSSGTAKFAEGLREVSRLGPDFANQANQIQGVLQEFAGFSQSLAGGDLTQVSGDISRRLSGILSGPQIEKIRQEILDFEKGKNDPAAVKALEQKLIEDAIGPFAQTLERGRQQINESLDNYSELLEKRNTIEKRIYDRRVESLKLEQDIQNKISEIRGDDPSLFQAGADRTARGRRALSGTGLGGRLTGNAANDVSFVAGELATNRNAQKLLQQNINSGRLDLAQQKSARSALQDLGLEADKLETSMQLLSDTTQETAILQKRLDESREGRKQKGELATELAFGTKESRFNFQQTLGLTKQAVQSGSAEVIPEEKRGDVLSLLKRFEKLPVFGGRTGAEVIKNLTGNFLRNQGFNESQIDEVLADMVPTEEKILKQIGANLTVDQIRNNLLERILTKLDGDVLAANPKSTGGPIYASTGKLVNYQPKGTDTVPAMLTPGEFVVKKSSVDKYGAGMLAAINAGNYATGGIINPITRSGGGDIPPNFRSGWAVGSPNYKKDLEKAQREYALNPKPATPESRILPTKADSEKREKQEAADRKFTAYAEYIKDVDKNNQQKNAQSQAVAKQQAAKANAQAYYQKEVKDFERETGQKRPVARNENTSEYVERSSPYYKAFQKWKNEQKADGDTIGYRRTETTNDINEKAAEVKTPDRKKSSDELRGIITKGCY
jgi:hypothetical protein